MGFFKLFSGKSPEEIEQKADVYFKDGAYGQAKIEYEKVISKLEKKSVANPNYRQLIEKKLRDACECLANEHKKKGLDLISSGCPEEAEELLRLALELTETPSLITEIDGLLIHLSDLKAEPLSKPAYDIYPADDQVDDDDYYEPEDDHFAALTHALPEKEQELYFSYGNLFKQGYLALNRGDFETAVTKLYQAMEDHPSGDSYISLELATALMNLGRLEEARSQLDRFIIAHPDSIKAYQLMCEIFWENNQFDAAMDLLRSCPKEIVDSLQIYLLKGETLYAAGEHKEAAAYYEKLIDTYGWNELIARALARTYENLGLRENARDIYAKIMNACTGCGSRIDPYIKERYADTSFETGDHSLKILELYLDLTQENPDNNSQYFQKISVIYEKQGNEKEAGRFRSFARAKGKVMPSAQTK